MSTSKTASAHALIFGVSGISGWALTNQCLCYPTSTSFSKVTGLSNRTLSTDEAYLPDDNRLQLVSGIDLTASAQEVANALQDKVKSIETVSHVFFLAYIEKPNYDDLREINVNILRNAMQALEKVAPKLSVVILQSGGKGYGVEFADKVKIAPPLKEDLPRVPKPMADNIFYYHQYDLLQEMSRGKSWTFSDVRPDVIVGFTPGKNFMNMAQGLGLYLTLWREVHGEGSTVPFPGTEGGYQCKHTDTFQDILAKQEIYVSLNRDKAPHGSSFNCANGDLVTWEQKWPDLCKYFGLQGGPPGPKAVSLEDYQSFVKTHQSKWDALVKSHGLKEGIMENYSWGFMFGVTAAFDFDRQYDLSAARTAGFKEKIVTNDGYRLAFHRMQQAKIIP